MSKDATPEETARVIERQLADPLLPDPALLPTWETCVAGVVDTYESITASRVGPESAAGPR